MPAKGRYECCSAPTRYARFAKWSAPVNKPINPKSLEPFRVTTGPLPASEKRYSTAPDFADVSVPYREIALHPSANEPPIRVYDTTGPYTDPRVAIDVHQGLAPLRSSWLAAR